MSTALYRESGVCRANEFTFQNDMIRQQVANDWLLGKERDSNHAL